MASIERISPKNFLAVGKLANYQLILRLQKIDLLIINSQISPVQQRNLEKEWQVKILDRTALILEIFSNGSRYKEGNTVEMAALSYQRSRLVRSWTHWKGKGAVFGFVGGPGETTN